MNHEDEKITGVLSSLKHVEAPADFEFHVKSKIARENSRSGSQVFFRALKFALPAILILGLGGLYISNQLRETNSVDIISQVETPAINTAGIEVANSSTLKSIDTNATVAMAKPRLETNSGSAATVSEDPKREEIASANIERNGKKQVSPNIANRGIGSRDSALSEVKDEIYPRGLDPKKRIEAPKDFGSGQSLNSREILSILGIETESADGKLKVKSLKSESVAARSGVKVGDVLEAIDGREISEEPIADKKFEGKKLKVKRGTEVLEISLTSQP